ncbi:MAG: hypothetical protein ACO3F5_02110, partial [Gemmatimonadaceae bacterium]
MTALRCPARGRRRRAIVLLAWGVVFVAARPDGVEAQKGGTGKGGSGATPAAGSGTGAATGGKVTVRGQPKPGAGTATGAATPATT